VLIFAIASITLLILGCVGYVLIVNAGPAWPIGDGRATSRVAEAWRDLTPIPYQPPVSGQSAVSLLPQASSRLVSSVLRRQARVEVAAHPLHHL
jgi:hypothetical protein